MPIGSGRIGGGVGGPGIKAAPGAKIPHKGLAWRSPALLRQPGTSQSRIFDATVPTYPTAFADARASSATYFNSSGVLTTAGSNVARIDYNSSSLALRGLLVEPSATNLVTTSDFTSWNQLAIFSVSAATGLDGTSTSAYDVVPSNSSTSGHLIYLSASSYTTPDTVSSCLSVYVKSSDFTQIAVRENTGACAVFSLASGGSVSGTFSSSQFTVSNPIITQAGGGWYRISAAFTANGAQSTIITFIPCDGWTTGDPYFTTISPAADNVKKITLEGPQAELGATSPSSVIISAGSTTTRAADSDSFTLNASATQLTFTFDNLSTQTVSGLTGGSTYTIPTNLNRRWILYIDDNSGAASNAYTLPAAQGSYSVTGQAATFQVGFPVGQGSYALTGQAATFAIAEAESFGSYALAGQAATFKVGFPVAQGSYSVTGQVATFAVAEAESFGSYSVSGQAATFKVGFPIGQGTYSVAGQAATFGVGAAEAFGSYSLSGFSATFQIVMPATSGLYNLTGYDAALAPHTVGPSLPVSTGFYVLTVGPARFIAPVTSVPVIPPDPRAKAGLRRIYPAAGVLGVYGGTNVYSGGTDAVSADFSAADFGGDFSVTGTPGTGGSGKSAYATAGALYRPLRRTSGPQMRRSYKYPVQLIPVSQTNIYKESVPDVYADPTTYSSSS